MPIVSGVSPGCTIFLFGAIVGIFNDRKLLTESVEVFQEDMATVMPLFSADLACSRRLVSSEKEKAEEG